MSWRDSLWAAAAVATHITAQAQENISHTLSSAAAKAQASYHDYQRTPTAPPSSDGPSTDDAHTSSSSSDASASLSSLASSLSTLPSSLSSLSLPSSLPSLFSSSLTPHHHPPPATSNTAPTHADTAHSEMEQLLPTLPSHPLTPPPTISLDSADIDDLPPLIVTKSSLTPLKLFTGHATDDSSTLRAPPPHPRPLSMRKHLLHPSAAAASQQGVQGGVAGEYVEGRVQAQVQLFAAQDEMMEDMRGSIARLGELSLTIGGEVREHEELLKEVGEDMDESSGLMEMNRRKLEKILRGAPRYHLYAIAALTVVVVVLFWETFFA